MTKLWVFKLVSANDRARRELLWLRAQEEGDAMSARDLERLDPDLLERLRGAGFEVSERPEEGPSERRARFGRYWHECYRRHERAAESACTPSIDDLLRA